MFHRLLSKKHIEDVGMKCSILCSGLVVTEAALHYVGDKVMASCGPGFMTEFFVYCPVVHLHHHLVTTVSQLYILTSTPKLQLPI